MVCGGLSCPYLTSLDPSDAFIKPATLWVVHDLTISCKWLEQCSNMTTQDHTRIVIKCLPSNVFLRMHSKLVK
jgi:hypothetical protein